VGRGCPLPTEERVWGGGCAPSPEIFKFFLVQCVQKNFVFRPKGGGHRPVPPLNTPLAGIYFVLARACGQLNFLLSSGSKLEVPANGHKTVVVVTTTKLKITA